MPESTKVVIQYSVRAPHPVQIEVPEFRPLPAPPAKPPADWKEPEPQRTERSCKGALHLRPGETKTVTPDELAVLQADERSKRWINVLVKELKPKAAEAVAPSDSPTVPSSNAPKPDATKPAK